MICYQPTSHAALAEQLERIGELGFAFDDEENDPHTRCTRAPVFRSHGAAIGCIGIDAPSVRLTGDRVARGTEHVVEVARRLSAELATTRTA